MNFGVSNGVGVTCAGLAILGVELGVKHPSCARIYGGSVRKGRTKCPSLSILQKFALTQK